MLNSKNIKRVGILIVCVLGINFISNNFYHRFDLTEDGRYTLSNPAKTILENVNSSITIKVYLEGEFPSEFKRLSDETRQLLEELKVENSNIRFRFINPLDTDTEALIESGLQPSQLTIEKNGQTQEVIIFPWATVQKGKKNELVSLLKDTNVQSQDEQLQNAIENLEYAFADAIHKITAKKEKKIAILKGNGQLDDIYIADFLRKIGEYYHLAPFTLDSVKSNPEKTLSQLTNFDLAIIAKPTEKFTENEKYTLDQFITNGGKSLWLLDKTHAELDSLMDSGESLAFPRDLNLTDQLFSYGVRINPVLVQDLYSAKIPLATGRIGNQTQYNKLLWKYYPVAISKNNHPINKHIEPINFKFANALDILNNDVDKTVLLQSSLLSKTVGTPSIISLKTITEKPDPKLFNNGNIPLAVLLEGKFNSAYKNRVQPFSTSLKKLISEENKMIVIADGDVIANQVTRGIPEPLGVDKYTGQQFGNKEFLLNCVNYLLDDTGLVQIRSKTIELKMLDREKAYQSRTFYQFLNITLPLFIIALFGLVFNFIRKKKYT
ncbi:gliding motility-associated ABC transporter substrate-binding protein GldG [Urechidicola vernalis]|uniref:Gliding motility-associated ABC transporter substrate-binding protein GldG n=1 Tax=Urechidicola vernalis TaxID=3075600 RepID=A0ABU2Y7J0_9FLAO|nr:gliding motility-associated ABC transporter substrate-binding protein GldG [Urechidicola sp. P050]MDT0553796.1 gliding motility-associated ABC transporter substrate-binding protein GldG [Urechidicola sp. P050]